MNKKIFLLLNFSFYCLSLFGQTIIDINIDKIYQYEDGEELVFLNKGLLSSYNCIVIKLLQSDYLVNYALECEGIEEDELQDLIELDYSDILFINETTKFEEWFRSVCFQKVIKERNRNKVSTIIHYDDELIVDLRFLQEKDILGAKKVGIGFWNYVYFRINNNFLIIGVIDNYRNNWPNSYNDDVDFIGFIIPTKEGGIFTSEGYDNYNISHPKVPIQLPSHVLPLSRMLSTKYFYRIKQSNNKYQIWDRWFGERILDNEYDKISFEENSVLCTNDNKVTVYHKDLNSVMKDGVISAYDSLGSIQYLKDNRIEWLDAAGLIHDTFPHYDWAGCGTIQSNTRRINYKNSIFSESNMNSLWKQKEQWIQRVKSDSLFTPESNENSYWKQKEFWKQKKVRDSLFISNSSSVISIKYLNNDIVHEFDEHTEKDSNSVFSFPFNTYIIETKENFQLVKLVNKSLSKEQDLLNKKYELKNRGLAFDSIDFIIENLKDELEIKIIFQGDLEAFGYNHPVRFKENGLYGYYPQNKKAKYRRINKFNFFFAEFELEDGRLGWLDIYGNEYFKE